ncbi:MAG: DUF2807 domain-containing protein [Gemmatimonadaceae bacterium]|nr:DUF2807 domain-containing protein [Chitinophagaceae bacterium]
MKKVNLLLAGIMVVLVVGSVSCKKVVGEGPVVTQQRTVNGFNEITMGMSGNLYYEQDSVVKVEIKAQQNILDVIETVTLNNDLHVRIKSGTRIKSHDPVIIIIRAPTMAGLSVSGSGNLSAIGKVTSPSMKLKISGSGNIFIPELVTNYVESNISGSGNIHVTAGASDQGNARISGSGGIDMQDVVTRAVDSRTSGSGTTRVHAVQSLNVEISGSGSVYYRGNPVVNVKTSGSGKVVKM